MIARRTYPRVALLTLLLSVVWGAQAQAAPVVKSGYITMSDGVTLRYAAALPAAEGRFPVAMKYDGYCEGTDPMTCNEGKQAVALLAAGYAVVGVSMRGTGCSGGQFDFRNPVEDTDGAAAVEWVAGQPWSTGHLGLFGTSFPGLTQPGVAALHPAGLDAIAPWQIVDDPYRDVSYPGGIANGEFGAFWAVYNQPAAATLSATAGVQAGEPQCVQNAAEQAANPTTNIFVTAFQHPYSDSFWTSKTVGDTAGKITVPAFACTVWQDDETGSRSAWTLWPRLNPARTWVLGSNGQHGMCAYSAATTKQLVRFFDRFVKGEKNGFEATPHTQIWHDTKDPVDAKPTWVTSSESWPPRTKTNQLYLGQGAALTTVPPAGAEPADDYVSPSVSAGTENGVAFGQSGQLWKVPGTPAGAQAYTTPKLGHDVELLGPASVDLWLKSTATDTNLQATITEVRPDGQEVYVNRGWLKASQRKLDERESKPTMPMQTHLESDVEPLEPGKPTFMRLEVFPFDYIFRAGSRIRVIIDTPSQTGGWNFQPLANGGLNSILHDAEHPSRIVLATVPGASAKASHPACDTVLNQPCRPDAFTESAPSGQLEWPEGGTSCKRSATAGFKLHRVEGTRVVRVEAFVNGKRHLRQTGRDIRRITLKALKRSGKMTVRIVATHNTGSKVVSTRSWNGCTKGKPSVRRIPRPR
jgi:putative CocE/NonD family hydrolase